MDIALLLESAIIQTAVIQSGYMNNKSETQIVKISNKEVKKCYQRDGNYVTKSCCFIDRVFLLSQQRSCKQSLS